LKESTLISSWSFSRVKPGVSGKADKNSIT
jgi:hypothetical protein